MTRVGRLAFVVVVLGAAVGFMLIGQSGSDPEIAVAAPELPGTGRHIEAGVYVLSIGQLDIATGTYVVDLYVRLRCASGDCDLGSFEFMNGRATSAEKLIDEPDEQLHRIQAELRTVPDLRGYPFDSQRITVEFEDTLRQTDELVYMVDRSFTGLDPDVILAGWELGGWQAEADVHRYGGVDDFSRFVLTIELNRPVRSSVFKTVIPGLIITGSGLLSLVLGAGWLIQRLAICSSALIGAIMFHINLTSQLPPLGYLTLADRFMLTNYLAVGAALAASVVLLRMSGGREQEEFTGSAAVVHAWTQTAVPVLWAVAATLLLAVEIG